MMTSPDPFLQPYWMLWSIVESLSIREASRLLAGLDPLPYSNRIDSDKEGAAKAGAINVALIRTVQDGKISPVRALSWFNDINATYPTPCEPDSPDLCDETILRVADLSEWAERVGIEHYWPKATGPALNTLDLVRYPDELRAAIEAFNAVRDDPKAIAGKTPKAALLAWLAANKPNLSNNARERIATVANWQPSGGAPETPTR